jgi:plastocyanin
MIHLARKALPIAILLALFVQSDAFASVVNVAIADFQFTPNPAKLKAGDSVTWTNNGPSSHTTTSDAPFSLWDSGTLTPGQSYSWPFNAAGIFPYHCAIHTSMHGQIGVKGAASPPSGPAGTVFNIRVAKITAPPLYVYDIQMKAPGGTWTNWMLDDTMGTVTWDSTGKPTGKYQFRSRLRRKADGTSSLYSPATTVTVT